MLLATISVTIWPFLQLKSIQIARQIVSLALTDGLLNCLLTQYYTPFVWSTFAICSLKPASELS